MATLEEYQAVAPTVMALGDFTLAQVENKLASIPEHPPTPEPPEITQAIVVQIFNLVFSQPTVALGVSRAGGYGQIARDTGLTKQQVKTVVSELKNMVDLYASEEV